MHSVLLRASRLAVVASRVLGRVYGAERASKGEAGDLFSYSDGIDRGRKQVRSGQELTFVNVYSTV